MGGSGPAYQGKRAPFHPSKLARLTGAQRGTLAKLPKSFHCPHPSGRDSREVDSLNSLRAFHGNRTGGGAGTRIVKTGLFVVCRIRRCFRTLPPRSCRGEAANREAPARLSAAPRTILLPGGKLKTRTAILRRSRRCQRSRCLHQALSVPHQHR